MGLYDKVTDKLANAISGKNIETINLDLQQFLSMLDKEFLSNVKDDSEFNEIMKVVKGSMFKRYQLTSKDGKYILISFINNNVGVLTATHRYEIRISETATDRIFQYNSYAAGSMKKSVAKRIADYKAGIASTTGITIIEDPADSIEELKPTCANCGAELVDGAKFCLKCGTPIPEKSQEKICPSCGAKLVDGAKFCLKCGAPVPEEPQGKTCSNCGAEIPDGAKFCLKCGKPIVEEPQVRTCPKCGENLLDGATFCMKCGTKIE